MFSTFIRYCTIIKGIINIIDYFTQTTMKQHTSQLKNSKWFIIISFRALNIRYYVTVFTFIQSALHFNLNPVNVDRFMISHAHRPCSNIQIIQHSHKLTLVTMQPCWDMCVNVTKYTGPKKYLHTWITLTSVWTSLRLHHAFLYTVFLWNVLKVCLLFLFKINYACFNLLYLMQWHLDIFNMLRSDLSGIMGYWGNEEHLLTLSISLQSKGSLKYAWFFIIIYGLDQHHRSLEQTPSIDVNMYIKNVTSFNRFAGPDLFPLRFKALLNVPRFREMHFSSVLYSLLQY